MKLCMQLATVRGNHGIGGSVSEAVEEPSPKVALEFENSQDKPMMSSVMMMMDTSTGEYDETEDESADTENESGAAPATGFLHQNTESSETKDESADTEDESGAAPATEFLHQNTESCDDELVNALKFHVATGDSKLLFQKIKSAEVELKNRLNQLELMKDRFNREIRPQLLRSCLVMPDALDSDLIAYLHGLIHNVLKCEPTYLSAFDVMIQEKTMDSSAFEHFVAQIISERVMVADVWDQSLGDVELSVYDFAPDGLDFYRGESDASFKENSDTTKDGVAKLSIMIWKDGKIIWAEVFEHIMCRTVNEAEVLAALALQLKCLELGVTKLKHFTDSAFAINVINGKHTIEKNDPERGKNMHSKYLLLRNLKEKFETLIAVQKPRQLMFMPDALLRLDHVPMEVDVEKILRKWIPYLRGAPVFKVHQNKAAKKVISSFGERATNFKHLFKPDTVYYLTVSKDEKFDAFMRLTSTLSADDLCLVIDKFEDKPPEFVEKICNFMPRRIMPLKDGTCSTFCWMKSGDGSLDNRTGDESEKTGTGDKPKQRKLCVVFDAMLPKHNFFQDDTCTIILTEPQEVGFMMTEGIKEISTAAFVQFHGVERKDKEEGNGKQNKSPKRNKSPKKNRKCRNRGRTNVGNDEGKKP